MEHRHCFSPSAFDYGPTYPSPSFVLFVLVAVVEVVREMGLREAFEQLEIFATTHNFS